MAVGASESRLAGAAEVPSRQADAATVWPTHIGRNVPHLLLGVISYNSNSAAVNHFTLVGLAVVFELRTSFALIMIRAAAVEVT